MSKKLVLSVRAILIFATQVYAEDGLYASAVAVSHLLRILIFQRRVRR